MSTATYASAQAESVRQSLDGEIDLRPTDEGWEVIAGRFIAQINADVTAARRADDKAILGSLIEIVFYLGSKNVGTADAKALRDRLAAAARGER